MLPHKSDPRSTPQKGRGQPWTILASTCTRGKARSTSSPTAARSSSSASAPSPSASPPNFTAGSFENPQAGQARANGEPHSAQNRRPVLLAVPQREQFIASPYFARWPTSQKPQRRLEQRPDFPSRASKASSRPTGILPPPEPPQQSRACRLPPPEGLSGTRGSVMIAHAPDVRSAVLVTLSGLAWFDLMFDVQTRKRVENPLPPELLASISAYYRRVTADAYPMNRLVALIMVLTLPAIGAEIVDGANPWWIGWSVDSSVVGSLLFAMKVSGLLTPPRRRTRGSGAAGVGPTRP